MLTQEELDRENDLRSRLDELVEKRRRNAGTKRILGYGPRFLDSQSNAAKMWWMASNQNRRDHMRQNGLVHVDASKTSLTPRQKEHAEIRALPRSERKRYREIRREERRAERIAKEKAEEVAANKPRGVW